jgi:hypothetical protein
MKITKTLLALSFAATALPAAATATTQFDFYKLGRGAAFDFLPIDGVPCTGGDLCSSNVDGNVRNGDLRFKSGGITAWATANFDNGVAAVVQDSESRWTDRKGAGLGVYHRTRDNSDDNITLGEMLTITFDQVVRLMEIELRSEGHNFTNWTRDATFLLDGVRTALPLGTGLINLDKTGKVFTFAFDGLAAGRTSAPSTGDQFYLSAMTVQTVPEPGTYAMVLLGLVALGSISRRPRRD